MRLGITFGRYPDDHVFLGRKYIGLVGAGRGCWSRGSSCRSDGSASGVFLHITSGPDNAESILALAFGVLIVFLVAGGSLVIMANLNGNMMEHGQPLSSPM